MTYIMYALGWILKMFYYLTRNYGVAIIVFTVFIKLAMLPLDLKQRKSLAKTQQIQPLLDALQKKYGNDKEKLNTETMKLYKKYDINPMGGCLPMLIQFPIIIALYWVVRKPIFYIMGVSAGEIWRIADSFNVWAAQNVELLPESMLKNGVFEALTYGKSMAQNTFGNFEIQVAQLLHEHKEILANPIVAGLELKPIDFNFLGMDLSETPSLGKLFGLLTGTTTDINREMVMLWTIPVLSGISSYISGKLSQPKTEKVDKNIVLAEADQPKKNPSSMSSMLYFMPILSAYFTFQFPAAVGLYWIVSNIVQLVQQLLVNKLLMPKYSALIPEGDIIDVKKSRKNRKK